MILSFCSTRSNVAALALVCAAATPSFGAPPASTRLPANMTPHMQTVPGGSIDWANGYVIADGLGKARGRTEQQHAMAERAATIVAARNAMAITLGIRMDASGRVSDIRNGEVNVRGVVRGHKVYMVDWKPDENPPRCDMKLRVPLWGVKGVCTVALNEQRRGGGRTRSRIALARNDVDFGDRWLIVDARGMGVEPFLFPSLTDENGRVLYDVTTIESSSWTECGPVRYVDSTTTVSAAAPTASSGESANRSEARSTVTERAESEHAAPIASNCRTVRAVRTGAGGADIVLRNSDAESVANSPEGASLLRAGRVIMIVDSPAIAAAPTGRGRCGNP